MNAACMLGSQLCLHIKDEIKYIYKKKETLNKAIYKIHLQAALEWGSSWQLIHDSIHNEINQKFETKYKLLDSKLSRLASTQKQKVDNNTEFYTRVTNKTDIDISNEDLALLNKGKNSWDPNMYAALT